MAAAVAMIGAPAPAKPVVAAPAASSATKTAPPSAASSTEQAKPVLNTDQKAPNASVLSPTAGYQGQLDEKWPPTPASAAAAGAGAAVVALPSFSQLTPAADLDVQRRKFMGLVVYQAKTDVPPTKLHLEGADWVLSSALPTHSDVACHPYYPYQKKQYRYELNKENCIVHVGYA